MVAGGQRTSEEEYQAALNEVAFIDRSDFGRIAITGKDGLDLLHRLSTNDLLAIKSGENAGTVFVTDKGRIVDYIRIGVQDTMSIAITSPGRSLPFIEWLEKYCIMEELHLEDMTSSSGMLSLIGPEGASVVSRLFGISLVPGSVHRISGPDGELVALRDDSFGTPVIDIIVPAGRIGAVRELVAAHAVPMGDVAYEAFRITRGIPTYGAELSSSFNPFEAGLRHAISFTKGCYLGQEVIARLDTYGKVQKKLVGLIFSGNPAALNTQPVLYKDSKEIGWLTSFARQPMYGCQVGLGIVRDREVEPGDSIGIQSGDSVIHATVKQIPFSVGPTHEA